MVDAGPNAIVRHPIYTGLIAASFATAGLKGTPAGLAGAILITLPEQLGSDAYDCYRRRVPMLIPFGPKSP